MRILKKDTLVINVDSDVDKNNLISAGYTQLAPEQIEAAGMSGYEHLVSPLNTIINADGSITFTPPPPATDAELFESLRIATEQRLAATDQYGMDDYPDNEKRAAFRAYRADLRAINRQPGAPFDGGGDLTPWPELPSVG